MIQISSSLFCVSLFDPDAFITFKQPIKPDDCLDKRFKDNNKLMKFCDLGHSKNNLSTQTVCCKYLLTLSTYKWVEANSVDPDQESSNWVHTVCLYFSHICCRQHKQVPFSGEHLSSALGECFSRKSAGIDPSVFLINE